MAVPGRRNLIAAALLLWAGGATSARGEDGSALPPVPAVRNDAALCQAAIEAVEQRLSTPRRLLSAISLIESGRTVPGGRVAAWPWTINVAGVGTFYETAEAAIAAAQALQSRGVRSFDVGCMQVNLMHHPAAFASLAEAFDPASNAAYAARFLGQLRGELGDWSRTVAAYHSRVSETGADYQRKVVHAWPEGASYGVVALPGLVRAPGAEERRDDRGPEFAARLREAAADHAALRRRIVGEGPSAGRDPSPRGISRALRLAQGGDGRSLVLRR